MKSPEIGLVLQLKSGADISSSLGFSFMALAYLHSRLVEGKGQDHWDSTLTGQMVSHGHYWLQRRLGNCFAFIVSVAETRKENGEGFGVGKANLQRLYSFQIKFYQALFN